MGTVLALLVTWDSSQDLVWCEFRLLKDPLSLSYAFSYIRLSFCCCSVTKSCLTLCTSKHTRLPCPSLSPGVCSDSCLLSWWCYLTISSSAALFFLCLQSFTLVIFPLCFCLHHLAWELSLLASKVVTRPGIHRHSLPFENLNVKLDTQIWWPWQQVEQIFLAAASGERRFPCSTSQALRASLVHIFPKVWLLILISESFPSVLQMGTFCLKLKDISVICHQCLAYVPANITLDFSLANS